jgi:uncharacterized protein YjdB
MIRHFKTLILAAGIAMAVTACSTTPSPTVTSITITGPQLAIGGSGQFTATANFSDGTTLNVSASSTWTSSNTAVATVSATGLVTGVSDGGVTITATYLGTSSTDTAQIVG